MSIRYDVIMIDTDPGVGTLAYKFAPSGKKILFGVNPSLTIIANALRVGDYLLERLRG